MNAGTRRRWRERGLALALLVPSLLVFGVFVFYPFARTFWLGFFETDPFGGRRTFVGLDQYTGTITSESFRNSLWVTLKFTLLTVPTGLALGLGLALLAHKRLRAMGFYRTVFSSTVATSVAVASLMFISLLSPSVGLVNQALRATGRDPIFFLQSPGWALVAISAVTVWQNLARIFRSEPRWSHENALRPGMIGVAEHQPNPEGGGRFHVST